MKGAGDIDLYPTLWERDESKLHTAATASKFKVMNHNSQRIRGNTSSKQSVS
jgi:hypothetical protein